MTASEQAGPPPGMPPQVLAMWDLMYGLVRTQALHAAAALGIADRLAEGPMNPESLAAATQCHAPSLARLVRLLSTCGICTLDPDGRYALTQQGQMLRSDAPLPMRAGATFYGAPFVWQAWGQLLETVRTGKTGFEIAHGTTLWDHLESTPEDFHTFTEFMTEMAGPRLASATAGYDFPKAGLVVDVGGGEGAMLVHLVLAHPGLRGLLLELPEVAAKAERKIAEAGLADRCQVERGSFLESVPAGGDVYILSNILHDWDDEHSLQILRNCRRSMAQGARLLVIDAVVPDRDPPFTLAALDLQMMVVVGGKQRTASELRELLDQSGFRLNRVAPPARVEAEAV